MIEQRKTVIVTGGSGGIGEGICHRLGQDWNVIVHFRSNKESAKRIVEELESSGTSAIAIQADLTDEKSVVSLFDQAIARFGSIDAVVANAGISGFGSIEGSELTQFQELIDVNLIGSYLTIREAARRINEGGRIVFVSSQLAERPRKNTGMYSACKAAIDAMIVSMSHELGLRGICINSVRPGATEPGVFSSSEEDRKEFFRELSPFKRLGTPADTAGVVAFLVSDDARWMTGQHPRSDGGASN